MTQISLRAYIREIDNLIERELLDEAIAHCRHILQTYPKHIETYRLLGKSYLEAKRYGDAADIFQRVLSAVPDDFVSHIGMAIVREDEGNLDSAIWHMERAFETNPANPAIQQELRRLIGRRDGFEPNKVRLTRGALARMYAQGELFPQAIAELQSALQEDQERPDLQVLLAEMLWQTDQKMEAADVSRQILEKLPFCQKAARIMAAVHQEQGKSDEGTAYHRRLAQLDPYAAYVEYPMVDTVKVEADTIRIERLDWHPGQPLPTSESAQPDWAESLGVEIEGDPDEIDTGGPLPSWLDDIEPTAESLEIDDGEEEPAPQASPFETPPSLEDEEPEAVEESPEDESPEDEIPDWMTDAGWEESSGETVEAPVSFSESELSALERGQLPAEEAPSNADDEELAPAEIPSWLQERAPTPGESQPPNAVQDAGLQLEDDAQSGGQEAPDWVQEIAEQESSPGAPDADEQDLTPDWLDEMATEASAEELSSELPSFEFAEEDEPVDASEATAGPADQGEIPGWLDDSEPGATSTILTWLGDREDDEDGQDVGAEEESETVPDWMEAALDQGAEDETIPSVSPEDESGGVPPAWLSGLAQAAAESDEAEFDELTQLRAESEATVEDDLGAEEAEAQPGEIPDWLMAIRGDETGEEEPTEADFEAELPVSFPWESDEPEHEEPTLEASTDFEDQSQADETLPPPTERTIPSDLPPADEADAASWLENLSEETDDSWVSNVEGTEDAGPDSATSWLEDLGQPDQEEPAAQMESSAEEPDWMRGLEDEETDDEAIGDLASTWLEGLADTLAETPAEPDDASPEAKTDSDDVPTWLLDYESPQPEMDLPQVEEKEPLAQEPAAESPTPPAPEDDTDRLQLLEELGLQESETSDTMAASTEDVAEEAYDLGQLDGMDDDQIFDWLEGLAARDADEASEEEEPAASRLMAEDTVEASEAPAEDAEADLGWLEQLAEQRGISSDIQAGPASASGAGQSVEDSQPEAMPDLSAEQPSEMAAPEAAPAESQKAPPTVSGQPTPAHEGDVGEPEETAAAEAPDWLIAAQQQAAQEPEAPPPPVARQDAPQAPPSAEAEPEPKPAAPSEVSSEATPQPETISPTEPEPAEEPQAPPPPVTEAEPKPAVPSAVSPEEKPQPESISPIEPEPAEEPKPDEVTQPAEPPATVPVPALDEPSVASDNGLERARAALETGNVDRAADEYSQLIKARRSLTHVVEDLEAALDRDPESSKLWQLLGDAYMKADRTSEAVKAYNRGMKEAEVLNSARQALASGDQQRAAAQYGILIKRKKKLDDVIRDLENAVAQADDQPAIWQVLGDAYMKADRLDESIEAYRRGMSSV